MLKNKLIAAIVVSLCIVGSRASASPSVKRIYGENRYETAAKICQEGWKERSDYAVVVCGENFPDAVCSAPLAKKFNAPILLTNKGTLNMYTSVELKRLNVKNAFIIGGKGVISQNVEDGIKTMGIKTTRLGGQTRYDTALQIAKKLGRSKQAVVVNGSGFEDAVSMAPIAANKSIPIIMVEKNTIKSDVGKYLNSFKKSEQVYVIGGENIISKKVFNSIPNGKRIGYGDKYQRNIEIINSFRNELNINNLYLASGRAYADALAGSTLAAKNQGFILLGDTPLPTPTNRFLSSEVINNVTILGGPTMVSYDLENVAKYLPQDIVYVPDIYNVINQNDPYSPPRSLIVNTTGGNKKEALVEWNLKKVDTSKPGMFTYYGTVKGYYRSVILRLVVTPIPVKIGDIYKEAPSRSSFVLPEKVLATMSDGTTSDLPVIWDYSSEKQKENGIYEFYGRVDKYKKKVKLTLAIRDNNGSGSNNQFDDIVIEIVQGETYKLPKTVLDKITNKNMKVTWNTKSIDTSKTGIVKLEGTVLGSYNKAYLTLIVLPKIEDIPEIRETVLQGTHYTLPKRVEAKTSDGKSIMVDVEWENPFVDLGTPQTYYIKGKVKHYNKPVLLVLKVVAKY